MKICFILGSFPYMDCGVGDYTSMLANALANEKNEVSVITSIKANNKVKKINVYNIIEEFNFKSIKIILDKLQEIQPDIVNFQYPSRGFRKKIITDILLPLIIKIKYKNIMLVETVHEYPEQIWKRFKMWNFKYKIMDKTIFVEEYYKDIMKRKCKRFYDKLDISYIPIGPNIPTSNLSEKEKIDLKETLGLQDKKIISYFGFARTSKGIENLFNAISLINDENIKLLYIGELRENNKYEKSLLDLINTLGIKDKVIIAGYLSQNTQVANYLSISDVCVLAYTEGVQSRYGSFLAACNQHIKIITTSIKDIEDEEGIYYIKPNDSKLLASKIEEVIYKTDIKSNKKINDWNDIAKQYMIAYNETKLNKEKK